MTRFFWMFFFCASAVGFACAPEFPAAFLSQGLEDRTLLLARPYFYGDLERLTGKALEQPPEDWSRWANSLNTEMDGLEKTLRRDGRTEAERTSLLGRYRAFREEAYSYYQGYYETPPPPFAFPEDLQKALPPVFALYVQGALAWHRGEREAAAPFWEKALALEPDKRAPLEGRCHYMLGLALRDGKPEESRRHFESCREMMESAEDPLGLYAECLGWEASLSLREKAPLQALRLYLEMYQRGSARQRLDAAHSLYYTCARVWEETPGKNWAAESRARELLTCWLDSRYFELRDPKTAPAQWLKTVRDHYTSGTEREKDRLAWVAYKTGQMENAAYWLDRATSPSLQNRWLRSKLYLREGRTTEALHLLQTLSRHFPREADAEMWVFWSDFEYERRNSVPWFDWKEKRPLTDLIEGERGVLLLGRKEYRAALDAFMRSPFWSDASYVADRVLTLDELLDYWKTHEEDSGIRHREELRTLLFRRLNREGRAKEAAAFCPEEEKEGFTLWQERRASAKDESLSKEDRAWALFGAARVVRHRGLELMGTELAPDWAAYRGQYDLQGARAFRLRDSRAGREIEVDYLWGTPGGLSSEEWQALPVTTRNSLSASAGEKSRYQASRPEPNRRWHYRWKAADMAWAAGKLLPDNAPLLARILWHGGSWLKFRAPEDANRFYQALVWRCGELEAGNQAQALRWFPPKAPAGPLPPLPEEWNRGIGW